MKDITKNPDFELIVVRPEAEPRAVQIDAYIDGLHLGQYTYYASSIKEAKANALRRIQLHGLLN